LRFYAKGNIRLDDVPAPTCAPDEVRLKVAFCGTCGTDLHDFLRGPIFPPQHGERNPHTGASLPVIMGHEIYGTVVEVGKDVSGVSIGQRVAVNPAMDDRHHGKPQCKACLSGYHNICTGSTFCGLNATGGGFSDEITVKPLALVPSPDNVPLKLAGLAEPQAVAAHMIRISGFRKGDSAVVLGAGPIGCALTFLLKHKSASKILVSEIAAPRVKQAASFGAD
ncbi:GroES-like protein, partial [Setomelanomma holmii]